MTDAEFYRIYTFLKSRYGVDMSRKKEIIKGRLENYVRNHGYDTYQAYMDALEADSTGEMERQLVNILTTNHTYFMRESEHFDFLREEVLPYLRRKEERNRDLRIWCGAASTGEEPYTLAMLLMDFFGLEQEKWDIQILATDISTEVLSQAIRGEYSIDQIQNMPDNFKRRFFRNLPDGESCVVTDELKKQVIYRKFNLMDEFPFRRKLHVVFLRNVMIYFDEETKREVIQKVYDVLEPGGYLFIGRTETIDKEKVPFEMVQPSIFRKPEVN